MYCPRCGEAYDDHVKECPECSLPLVENLDEATEAGELVRVRECFGLAEAEELVRALDMAGIPSFLNNENMAALFPGAMGGVSGLGLGRVVIMVPSAYAERAHEVIARALSDLEEGGGD